MWEHLVHQGFFSEIIVVSCFSVMTKEGEKFELTMSVSPVVTVDLAPAVASDGVAMRDVAVSSQDVFVIVKAFLEREALCV